MKVPGFSDFGKSAKELLYGGGQGRAYQYDQKLKLSSKPTDGMVGAPWLAEERLDEDTTLPRLDGFRRRKREAERADGFFAFVHAEFDRQGRQAVREFKSSYSYERYSVDETVNNANTVTVKGNIADFLVPGLKCTSSFALQATSPSKVGLQHSRPYLITKVDVVATTSPKVTASLASGYARMLSAVQTALVIVQKGHSPHGALALCILGQGTKQQHYTMTRGS